MIEQLAEMMNLMSNGEIGEIMTRDEIASNPKKVAKDHEADTQHQWLHQA